MPSQKPIAIFLTCTRTLDVRSMPNQILTILHLPPSPSKFLINRNCKKKLNAKTSEFCKTLQENISCCCTLTLVPFKNRSRNGKDPIPDATDPRLRSNTTGINWTSIARTIPDFISTKTATDCRIHYLVNQHPSVNRQLFSKAEVQRLQEIGETLGWVDWDLIASELGVISSCLGCLLFLRINSTERTRCVAVLSSVSKVH
ncbi:hypothetical protein BDR26DRAFT_205528 [Obelidium mucronatum]|nr:hypothetical protein BDR26DRAFT_205528 [Obelidium mucronatum]